MKKFTTLLLTFSMLLSAAACSSPVVSDETTTEEATTITVESTTAEPVSVLTPGSYQATAQGRAGSITVEITVDENSITKVEVVENNDTATISDYAIAQVTSDIVTYQTVGVDTVAGATLTSIGVRMAATEALKQAAEDISAFQVPASYPASTMEDTSCDIVVVGAGSAGMIAAIKASEGNANVILVEKQGILGGGDTMFASSGLAGGGGSVVEAEKIEDHTEEDYLSYLLNKATTKNIDVDIPSMTAYSQLSGDAVDFYISIGVPFGKYVASTFSNKTEDGSSPGTHIIRCLGERLDALGVDYRLNTRATSIIMEDGTAKGIVVSTDNGEYSIYADAIILATGGFGANDDLVAEYAPQWLGLPSTGAVSATGDGILMAQEAGADVWNMDQTKANNLCHVAENGATISLAAIQNNIVLVNKEGQRFIKESNSSINAKSYAELEQTDKEVYAIFDSTMMDSSALLQGYMDLGYFVTGNTMEELAANMDIDQDAFIQTMERYHQYCADGEDLEFGTAMTDTLEDAPYYAALVTPSMQSTYGGVRTDEHACVISTSGTEIPGLFAAGAISGHGCFGNEVGNGLTIASTFGMIAAESALEYISK